MQATILSPAISPGLLYHSRNDAGPSSDPYRFSSTPSKPKRQLRAFPSSNSSSESAIEEELVWYGKTVIWSRGAQIFRKYTFNYEGEDVAWAEFVWFKRGGDNEAARNVRGKGKATQDPDETFGPFHTSQHYNWGGPRVPTSSTSSPSKLERTLIIFLQSRAHIYFASGEDIIINMPFVVDGAWPLQEGGVVLQRALEKREIRRMKRGQNGKSVLRGMDQSSMSVLDDLVDLEDENTPSLPRLYTLDDPFHELKMIVEARVDGGYDDIQGRILSQTTAIAPTSTLLHLSDGSNPLVVYYDHTERSIIFARRVRVPTAPETPPPPTPGPRTARPEDILKPPEHPPNRPRPSLHRNPSGINPTADRRTSINDPFERPLRRNQPRLSRGDQDLSTGDLQAALETGTLVNPALMVPPAQTTRARGMSIVSAPSENRRTSGASSFMRQDMHDVAGKNALHVVGEKDLRETTMMMGLEREEVQLRSDLVLDKIWSWKPPSDTKPAGMKLFVSDNLSPGLITLNIHLNSAGSFHLLTFRVQFETDSKKYTVTPFQSLPGIAAVPLIATRRHVLDVLVLSADGKLELVTSGGRSIPVAISPLSTNGGQHGFGFGIADGELSGNVVDLVDAVAHRFTIVMRNGRRLRVSADFTIKDELTSSCMEAISLSLDPQSFFLLKKEVLIGIQQLSPSQRSDPCDIFAVFTRTLSSMTDGAIHATPKWSTSSDPIMKKLAAKLGKAAVEPEVGQRWACNSRLELTNLAPILLALHLVAQNCRMLPQQRHRLLIIPIVCQLAAGLGGTNWLDYWMRTFPVEYAQEELIHTDTSCLDQFETPPDIFAYLSRRLVTPTKPFPSFPSTLSEYGQPQPLKLILEVCEVYDKFGFDGLEIEPQRKSESLIARASAAIVYMVDRGLGTEWLTGLPHAVAIPILEMIRVCQNSPNKSWSSEVLNFIGRTDLSTQRRGLVSLDENGPEETETEQPLIGDLISLDDALKKSFQPSLPHVRFGSDRRLQEVERIMQTTKVRIIAAQEHKNASEQDIIHYHQNVVNTIANRTLSTTVGQGIFEFGTRRTNITGLWEIPLIELSVKIVPGNSVLKAQLAPETGDWACFHNGVSAGLSISPDCKGIDSSWIVFNRPHTLTSEHGGFLLGLGLTGHLRSLHGYHAFPYMEPRHEPTSIGLLLGLACSYAGSGDFLITKILSLHTHALLPLGSMELHASPLIQSSAILGLGLVYAGSKNHRMAEVALNEVGRSELPGTESFGDYQEAYAFSASVAFGLIMLGRGGNSEVDRRMLVKLRRNINGDPLDLSTTATSALTSPGATLALGLMYLKTGRKDVADNLELPKSVFELDQIRPELLLLRIFARSLIMWDEISPAIGWIESQLPAFIQHNNHKKTSTMDFATELAYLNIIAGACFAIGIKYAGTAAELAHNNLMFFFGVLGKTANSHLMTYEGKIRRNTARAGLNIITIALAAVMSGTGELNVLRRLRVAHGQEGAGVNYGSHMALHMATGLLFLGRGHYTLGNSNLAIAAMCIAFFPRFLSSAGDNKAHPQAFRHLWALAVEPRCLIAKDVDTKETVYLPVKVKLKDGDRIRQQSLISPTLIAPFESLMSIEVDSPRYWPVTYDLSDPADRANLVRSRTIYVKRKAGFLDYNSDPKGNRSIFIRAGSMTGFDMHYDLISPAAPPGLDAHEVADLVSAHSGSPYLVGLANLFDGPSSFEIFLRTVILECISLDKQAMIGVNLSIYLGLQRSSMRTHELALANFSKSFYSPTVYDANYLLPNSNGERRIALLRPTFLVAIGRHLASVGSTDSRTYFASGAWPPSTRAKRALAVDLARNHIPPLDLLEALVGLVRGSRNAGEDVLTMKARDTAAKYGDALERVYDIELGPDGPGVPPWRAWKAFSAAEAVRSWLESSEDMTT